MVLFLASFVSGYQLGVGPPEITLESGECGEIYVFSNDYIGEIEIRDKWAEKRGSSFEDYNLDSEDIGLDVRYFKNFELNNIGKTKICIYGSGKYYGLILFRAVDGNIEVGTRIIFNGDGRMSLFERNILSGMAISDENVFFEGFGAREMVLMSSFAVSFVLLWFLLFILRKERDKEAC
jgi:hypothetical protein